MFIEDLGWNAYFEAQWNNLQSAGCVPARVVSQHRGLWRIAGDFAECWAEPSGKLRLASESGADWPAVGDWVAAERHAAHARALIEAVLPRRSCFSRKIAGQQVAEQVLAANLDVALIVAALDGDFNLRRIERYMAQCWESGARPAIVLNKADTCADFRERLSQAEQIARGVPVFPVSAKTGAGVDLLESGFKRGQTIVLLGSSGVGKSTLLNRMLREERQPTQAVRESDSRGRHTTTSRELFVLPGGAIVIDTPGLRELQLWDADGGLSRTFADIDELGAQCRFRDCQHRNEPGCAVQSALASGILATGRLENWRKLGREQEFLLRKMDAELRLAQRKSIKTVMRRVKRDYQQRDKGKS